MSDIASKPMRSRVVYVGWMAMAVCAGLMLRSGGIPLEGWFVKYGGDALWALVVFLCLGVAWPSWSTYRVGGIAVGASWMVEFLQLYHAPWIDSIRATAIGRLVLGHTFNPPDLAAYAVGILVGVAAECVCFKHGGRSGRIAQP